MTMGNRTTAATRWIVFVGLVLAAGAAAAQDAQDQPRFRSGVDLTSVDVTVVDDRGRPILGLKPEDFSVRLDGGARRVISADWVSLTAPEGPKPPPPPEGYTSNEGGSGGRLILLVVDQPNIRFGGFFGIRRAVNGFIDRLQPSDRVALVGIGPGAPSVPFTADRERLRKAVDLTTGQRQTMSRGFYQIAISEAMAIRRGDGMILQRVQKRECGDPETAPASELMRIEMCFRSVENEANSIATVSSFDGEQTVNTFRDLLSALRTVNSPNTLVLITEGFVLDDQHPSFMQINDLAAAARTSIYVMKLDEQIFEITESRATEPTTRFEDRLEKSIGVEMLASSTRGSLFNVVNGSDYAFERIEAELSGQYLLGVETNPLDKDGKPHQIKVEVNRRGVTVRSRRQLTMRPEDNRPRTARETVMAGLTSPLPLSALPLRVATFALQGQGRDGKVQLLIHADIGVTYTSTRSLSLGYMFTDKDGRIIESQAATARLKPMMDGVPSPLQFTGGAALPPGEYTLKIAVVDGDLAGSLEHPVQATLMSAGSISLSELMVGGPVDPNEPRPTVGHTVSFGNLQAYMEAYGAAVKDLKVRYEIAATPEGAALLAADVPPRAAGDERAIFNRTLPVRQLPPGNYMLRAVLTDRDRAGEKSAEPPAALRDRTAGRADDVRRQHGARAAVCDRAVPSGRRGSVRSAVRSQLDGPCAGSRDLPDARGPRAHHRVRQGSGRAGGRRLRHRRDQLQGSDLADRRQHRRARLSRRDLCRIGPRSRGGRARGRRRSSTALEFPRSTSGSATRCCACTTCRTRERCSRKPSASGRPTLGSPSRWRCSTRRWGSAARRCGPCSAIWRRSQRTSTRCSWASSGSTTCTRSGPWPGRSQRT